jgi:hypothetical protein
VAAAITFGGTTPPGNMDDGFGDGACATTALDSANAKKREKRGAGPPTSQRLTICDLIFD